MTAAYRGTGARNGALFYVLLFRAGPDRLQDRLLGRLGRLLVVRRGRRFYRDPGGNVSAARIRGRDVREPRLGSRCRKSLVVLVVDVQHVQVRSGPGDQCGHVLGWRAIGKLGGGRELLLLADEHCFLEWTEPEALPLRR